jgi:hypothetical protein
MQPLARFQIELVEETGDGGRCRRTHRLLDGPQGCVAVRGLDQDQACRIEPQRAQAMTMKPARGTVGTQPIGRHDEKNLFSPPFRGRGRNVSQNCRDEADGGGERAFPRRHDFMQGAAGQTAVGQVGIKRGKAEGRGLAQPLHAGEEPSQFCHHGGAVARQGRRRRGSDRGRSHRGRGRGFGVSHWLCKAPWIFAVCSLAAY